MALVMAVAGGVTVGLSLLVGYPLTCVGPSAFRSSVGRVIEFGIQTGTALLCGSTLVS